MSVFHKNLTGTDLHEAKVGSGAGAPLSTPFFIGQTYIDTDTKTWYIALGIASSADWKPSPLSHIGNHTLSLTTTANTAISLPVSGTLATLSNTETLQNKTLASGTVIKDFDQSNTLTLPNLTSDDEIVTKNFTQTLLNKTIIDVSNIVAANSLKTTGALVTVNTSAPPNVGYVLTALSSTQAEWQSPGGSGGGHTIQDEGSSQTQRLFLNFVGAGVTVTDGGVGPNSTIVTIPGTILPTWKEDKFVASGSAVFTLSFTPTDAQGLFAYVNGLFRTQGISEDYTISTNVVTFNFTPSSGDIVAFKYQH